jgi:xanthine dehydrogenase molybdopterin-binding subunit B
VAGTCGYSEELSGSINAGNFLTSDKVYWFASQEGLCSME